jgi:hypothetical protein
MYKFSKNLGATREILNDMYVKKEHFGIIILKI